jgi:hypothetical protein
MKDLDRARPAQAADLPQPPRAARPAAGIGGRTVRLAAGIVFAWVLLEGGCSLVAFAARVWSAARAAGERHTRFDPELGWVSIPNLDLPDHFGPGVYLRTNALGLRDDRNFAAAEPSGRRRVVCSGDSFTFGYGVDNDHTWCRLLETLEPSLETVNMGQGGYGVDQSYLWYRRDGARLHHRLHLFAMIGLDFGRMASGSYLGAPKPRLALRGGRLQAAGTPLPRPSPLAVAWARYGRQALALPSAQLAAAAAQRLGGAGAPAPPPGTPLDPLAAGVVGELAEIDRRLGSRLVLVFLPRQEDFESGQAEHWRQLVAAAAAASGLELVDLFDDFRRLAPAAVERLFIQPGGGAAGEAVGHYSNAGNAWVAREIHRRLAALGAAAPRPRQGK